jgi:carboxymethylenebutenolidase
MSEHNEILTEWVQIPVEGNANAMPAFLARPAPSAPTAPSGPRSVQSGRPAPSVPRPAVMIGFEMFGVTGYLKAVAELVAAAGYLALVPDFYHWQSADGSVTELIADASGRARGLELINGLRRDQVTADVNAAIGYLTTRPDYSGQAAMVGLSAGGHIAYYAATQIPLAALVTFYPGWLTGSDVGLSRDEPVLTSTPGLAALGTPVLIMAGADDHLYAPGDIKAIETALADAGVDHEVVVYPGTPHGFACFERETYRPEAAADAWRRAHELLTRMFGSRNNPLAR